MVDIPPPPPVPASGVPPKQEDTCVGRVEAQLVGEAQVGSGNVFGLPAVPMSARRG